MKDAMKKMTIEDRTYGVIPMPPLMAAPLGLKAVKVISPILVKLVKERPETIGELSGKSEQGQETFGMMILEMLEEVEVEKLDQLFKIVYKNGIAVNERLLRTEDDYNMYFSQYPQDLLPVSCWALWENVKSFFTGIGAGIQAFTTSSD